MNILGRASIRTKWITLLILCLVVSGGLIGATTYRNWAHSAEQDAIQLSLQTLTSKKNFIDEYLNERMRTIETIWYDDKVQEFIASSGNLNPSTKNLISDLLAHEMYTKSDLIALILYDDINRTTIYSAKNKVLDRSRQLQFPFELPHDVKPHLIPPHDQNYFINGEEVFTLVRGITTGGSTVPHQYIVMDIGMDVLQKLMDDPAGEDVVNFITDTNGTFLYHPDRMTIGKPFAQYKGNETNERQGYRVVGTGDERELLTYVRSDISDWIYYTSIPYAKLLKNVAKNRDFTLLIIAVSIMAATLIAAYISYRMTQPLIQLKQMMTKVEKGDFSVHVPTDLRDEVGYLTISFNRMVMKLEQLTRVVYLSKISETEAALKQLQAQINPHFLYNTLDSIHSMATVEGIPSIAKVASSLSHLFRYSISNGERLSTINEEMRYVGIYLDIQRIRFKDRFAVFTHMDTELQDTSILKFIIQPIVENAFHHGLEPKPGSGRLWITVRKEERVCAIRISDDGVGMNPEQVRKLYNMFDDYDRNIHVFERSGNLHIGLMNVHRRLRLQYGDGYEVLIQSELGTGTSVEIRLKM